jgi:N-glycosylase/DNA lyase
MSCPPAGVSTMVAQSAPVHRHTVDRPSAGLSDRDCCSRLTVRSALVTRQVTRASGRHRVVLARYARNRRLADALHQHAFSSLTRSPGARAYYDQLRHRGKTHHQALRQLANRWTGILHVCLDRNQPYDENAAWGNRQATAA